MYILLLLSLGFKVRSSFWHLFLPSFISGQMTLPNSFYRLWERVWALCPVEPCCIHQAHLDMWQPYLNAPQICLSYQAHVDMQTLPPACRSQALSRWLTPISADIVSPHFCHPLSLPPKPELLNHRVNAGPHTSTSLNQPLCNRNAMIWSCSVHATLPLSQGLCSQMTINCPKLISGFLIHGILIAEKEHHPIITKFIFTGVLM